MIHPNRLGNQTVLLINTTMSATFAAEESDFLDWLHRDDFVVRIFFTIGRNTAARRNLRKKL